MTRHRRIAPLYDWLSLEWPVYRGGRVEAIRLAELRRGDQVMDVGCGTGLSFPLLQEAVGPAGLVVGVDLSPQMLGVARRRAERTGWRNARLVAADATTLSPAALERVGLPTFDAAIATYSLSLMPGWRAAWHGMCGL